MKYIVIFVFTFSLLISATGYGADEELPVLSEQLMLSGEQKQELKEKYQEMGEKVKKLQVELRVEMARLGEELKKDEPDKGRINKLSAKIKRINNKLFDFRIKEVLVTKDILNKEQYSRLQKIRQQRLEALRKKVKKIDEEGKK